MDNDQEIKRLELALNLQHHLTGLPPLAVDVLVAEIMQTPSGKDHVLRGMSAPSMSQLADELWVTEQGQNLKQVLAEKEAERTAEDQSERAARLRAVEAETNPYRRLTMARQLEADIASGAVQ